MRSLFFVVILVFFMSVLPVISAHEDPPIPGGIVFALSGSGSNLELVRGVIDDATQGNQIVRTGDTVIGTWSTEPLSSDLFIESTSALVTVYGHPGTGVIGEGMSTYVEVLVDGELAQAGESEIIIMNEPLWIAVPWTSEPFDLEAQAGQVIEVRITAKVQGIGAIQVQWGESTNSPSVFALANWNIGLDENTTSHDGEITMTGNFNTPWNCSDITSIKLEIRGPVDDHDILWTNAPESELVEVERTACEVVALMPVDSGIYLHSWTITMVDDENFTIRGYNEFDELIESQVSNGFYINLAGGILGVALLSTPFVGEIVAGGNKKKNWQSIFSANSSHFKENISILVVIATIGLLVGVLSSPLIVLISSLGIFALYWAVSDL